MNATMKINCDELASEDIQEITMEMMRVLNRETDVTASLPEESAQKGARGDAVTLGQLALTALSGGAAVAMFNVFKSYIERRKSLVIEIKGDDGKTLSLNAENLSQQQFDPTLEMATNFTGE